MGSRDARRLFTVQGFQTAPPPRLAVAFQRLIPAAAPKRGASLKLIASTPSEPDLDVREAWIADLSDVGRQIPRPIS